MACSVVPWLSWRRRGLLRGAGGCLPAATERLRSAACRAAPDSAAARLWRWRSARRHGQLAEAAPVDDIPRYLRGGV